MNWDTADLPMVPLMINKKAIKAHARLVVSQDLQKSKGSSEAVERS